jgi:hypothetical protein
MGPNAKPRTKNDDDKKTPTQTRERIFTKNVSLQNSTSEKYQENDVHKNTGDIHRTLQLYRLPKIALLWKSRCG